RRVAAGFDAHRVQASVWPDRLTTAIDAGLCTGDLLPGGGDLLTMGYLKVISDGSLNTRTAWCHEPFGRGEAGAPDRAASGQRRPGSPRRSTRSATERARWRWTPSLPPVPVVGSSTLSCSPTPMWPGWPTSGCRPASSPDTWWPTGTWST